MWKIAFISIWMRESECFGLGVWSGSTINHIVVTVCRFEDSWQFATLEWVSRGVLLLLVKTREFFFFLGIFHAYFVCISSSHPQRVKLRKKNKNFGHRYVNRCKFCLSYSLSRARNRSAYEKRKNQGTGFQLISINCISWFELNATKTEKNLCNSFWTPNDA